MTKLTLVQKGTLNPETGLGSLPETSILNVPSPDGIANLLCFTSVSCEALNTDIALAMYDSAGKVISALGTDQYHVRDIEVNQNYGRALHNGINITMYNSSPTNETFKLEYAIYKVSES